MYLLTEDPGHAWLRVPRKELTELGIADKITSYSYQKGDYVYLEEDCDMTTFIEAKAQVKDIKALKEWFEKNVKRVYRNYTHIRNYQDYRMDVSEK